MCGIAGFELRGDDAAIAGRLLGRLARRGPDGGWYTPVGAYGLVQTRLAVIDLSDRVRYPLRNEGEDLHLLFNGEIYDYGSHRDALRRRGHRFVTECDAEVLLHGYEEWGSEVFRRVDGMFACALLDLRGQELILARDALGIKPLVYTTAGTFAFASEATALVAAGLSSGELDREALGAYLAFHHLAPPATGLRDVQQVRAGELVRRSIRGATTTERWRARPFSHPPTAERVELAELEATFDRSVRRQLVADVPVGVFLSSGLDSSLVLDSAVRAGARPTAFTIGFPGHGDYDETRPAARFARDLAVPHVVGELAPGFVESVTLVADAFDQPFADSSAIATLQLADLARAQVTVALSGTGGDDLFAGYYRHRAHRLASLVNHLPAALRRQLREMGAPSGGERRSLLALARAYAARLASVEADDPASQYLALATSRSSVKMVQVTQGAELLERARRTFAGALEESLQSAGSILRAIQAFELENYLAGDLLPKEDRATMAVGLEGRVPLLGTELVALAERAADEQKVGFFGGKLLLRRLAKQRLPAYLTRARKRGFAVPLHDLLMGSWRNEAVEWFAGSESAFVDCNAVSANIVSRALRAPDVWALAALVGWEQSIAVARQRTAGAFRGS